MAQKYSTVDTLRQQYVFIPAKYKDCYLAFILNELSGSTSMVRDLLVGKQASVKHGCCKCHAAMAQSATLKLLQR